MRIASLFSGAGGFELGLGHGHSLTLLNDNSPEARQVLLRHFPGVRQIEDVVSIVPGDVEGADALVAGFPCQDVSIVGGQKGMAGLRSALVEHVFALAKVTLPEHILLENVQSIRFVHGGRVLSYLMHSAEALGYAWAYRILDSRAFGLPQRRRRFYFLASRTLDPGAVLLADAGEHLPPERPDLSRPIGFYWTEGRLGHGLTDDAIPPLKTGSAIGIPSPPAVLLPTGEVVVPTIETAERLQGMPSGWTLPAPIRSRWRLVGNAVSPPVAAWVGASLANPKEWSRALASDMPAHPTWPHAAYGDGTGRRYSVAVGEAPTAMTIGRLSSGDYAWEPISDRALSGFIARAKAGRLNYPAGFLDKLSARSG